MIKVPAMPVSAEAVLAEKPNAVPDKLDKAAKDFESLIVGELLKSMRATMPKGGLSGSGFDRDIVTGMFDEQIAKCIAETGAFGVGNMVRGSMAETEPAQLRANPALLDEGWTPPVDDLPEHYAAAQRFGAARAHAGDHQGLDIPKPAGTPVHAARAGTVVGVCRDPSTHGGLQITIAHDNGRIRTRYMHLDSIDPSIKPGVELAAGTSIGTVGNTGTSSHGAHLHFEVEAAGTHVDPQGYLQRWGREKP